MQMKVSSEDFVKVWLQAVHNGHNMTWVANQLGYRSRAAVSARAFNLRDRGVELPKLSRHKQGEKARLNNLIKKSIEASIP
jgi:hypothetical protein